MNTRHINIFYSYAEEDEKFRVQLQKHLSLLKRQGKISGWHFRMITAGNEWKGYIDQHINEANIILLLISADFLNSDYCYDVEMRKAMSLHETGSARVIPIILRSCDWQSSPFGGLQALPEDAKAITKWSNRDDAFLNIVQGIKNVINELGIPNRHNAEPTSTSVYTPTDSQQRQATNKYCSRCGVKVGRQSECTGTYMYHQFKEYSGDVYCSRCGAKAGQQSECTGTYTYHKFEEYSGDVYCSRCGAKAGRQSECTGTYMYHQFKEYSGDVYCSRCGAKAGQQSECTGTYTYHQFIERR
ncbi:MAG TPA: toll/interleukin-1 receptor domain-containing protein [Dehalococcoidales bacterium]